MYKDAVKETAGFLLNLLIAVVAAYAFITLVLYPRPWGVDTSTSDGRWFKERFDTIPMLEWKDDTLSELVGYAKGYRGGFPGDEGGQAGFQSKAMESHRVFVTAHKGGYVSGAALWEVRYGPDASPRKYWARFRIPEGSLPPMVEGQVRRFDTVRSRWFRATFIGSWVFLALMINAYPCIKRWLTVAQAVEPKRPGALEEFRRYQAAARQVAMLKRKGFTEPRKTPGDQWYARVYTWREYAIAAAIVMAVAYTLAWGAYMNPGGSPGEVDYMVKAALQML